MFGGHYNNLKKVFYSTTIPSGFASKESKSKPLDLLPHWSYRSQITSSDKIHVPTEALTTTIEFPSFTEYVFIEHEILLPNNLQPLSFPSKPRDPPVA